MLFIQRVSLIKRLGVKDAVGNFEISADKKEEFLSEIERLVELEVSLNFSPLKLSDFKDIKISASDAIGLEPIFDIE